MDFSNPIILIISVVLLVLVITGIIFALLPYLRKKGYDIGKMIETADNIVDKASAVIDVTEAVLPPNPILTVILLIEKWAKISVNSAEQMYIASQLEKEQRKESAKTQVYAVLKLLGVEITEEIDVIIDGAIEAEVMALGHSKLQ